MIKSFLHRRKLRKALANLKTSALGKFLEIHTDEYFKEYPRLSNLSEENKNQIITDFYKQVFSLADGNDPFLAMRECLANYIISYTRYQVLCLTKDEKVEAFYSECPYISGEIYKHINQAASFNDELRELRLENSNISSDQLISFCNTRCFVHLYYVNGINLVRGEIFNDIDKDMDWLRPFIRSMLIWEEDQIRDKIGLPSLLPDNVASLKHSTFMNIVINGHKNPVAEWEKSWGRDGIA